MEEQEPQPTEDQGEPEFLYHYTTEKGLYGILESGRIWATHYRFLNDFTECQEMVDRLELKAQQRMSYSASPPLHTRELKRRLLEGPLDALKSRLREADMYVISLTDDSDSQKPGDRLSLWRGYADDGRGFSLGFSRKNLKEKVQSFVTQKEMTFSFKRCLYGRSPDEEEKIRAITTMWAHGVTTQNIDDYLPLFAFFKNQSFFEEQEWRFALLRLPDCKCEDPVVFHFGQFGQTPHVAVTLDFKSAGSPLERIVVGPSPDRDHAAEALKRYLKKNGIKKHGIADVPVVVSGIPFRGR
jgi:hypothetical protein